MKRQKRPGISPVIDILPWSKERSLLEICDSGATTRLRIGTRETLRIHNQSTGEAINVKGPMLLLWVNEALLKQGW